jgi:hypothetical protein
MSTKINPVELAKAIFEGKTETGFIKGKGFKQAYSKAIEEGEDEFTYSGKTMKVSDFKDLDEGDWEVLKLASQDAEGKLQDDDAGTSAAKKQKKAKEEKAKASSASGKTVDHLSDSVKLDVEGMLEALFTGEDNINEDFKVKARTIFESAVKARVKDVAIQLEEEANARVEAIVEANKEELTESLDDYLGYVVEEWTKENQIAIDRGIKSDIAESFMMGLKNLFEAHYIDMPDEKYNMVEASQEKTNEMEAKLNEEIQSNVELHKQLQEAQCASAFNNASDGLADTQKEKLAKLAEGIDYDTVSQFAQKLQVLKESYFRNKVASSDTSGEVEMQLNERSNDVSKTAISDPSMRNYSSYLDRQGLHNK